MECTYVSNLCQMGCCCDLLYLFSRFYFYVVHSVYSFIFAFREKQVVEGTDDEVLNWSATEIAKNIKNRKITVSEVVEKFIHRTQEVDILLKAVATPNFENARRKAKEYDDVLEKLGNNEEKLQELFESKPLFGVPFTVKDHLPVKGLPCVFGMVWRKDIIMKETCAVVQRFFDAGAICIALTNMPEGGIGAESHNHVFGRTANPFDTRRSAAGSSGGEGALNAAQATPFGIGSDCGGSIRLPAAFCGVFGLLPSPDYLDGEGIMMGPTDEIGKEMARHGPLTRFASDFPLIYKVMGKDGIEHGLRLDENVNLKNIHVFYIEEMKYFLTDNICPEQQEAFDKVRSHLGDVCSGRGKLFDHPALEHSFKIFFQIVSGMKAPESPLKENIGLGFLLKELVKLPLGMSEHTLQTLFVMLFFGLSAGKPDTKYAEMCESLRQAFSEAMGNNGVLILPSVPQQACFHTNRLFTMGDIIYQLPANILLAPSVIVPMGISENGLPMSVQIIAPRKCDRLLLAVAAELERSFGGFIPPSTY